MPFDKGNDLWKSVTRKSLKERFEAKFVPEPNSGCWLWTGMTHFDRGYGLIKLRGSQAPPEGAHRVSWQLYRGEIPEEMCVLHRCDTPLCVNPDHLFLGTHRDNNLDMRAKRRERPPFGERHWNVKLTSDQVREIRETVGTQAAIARQFGVAQSQISRIKNNKQRTKEAST